MCKDTNIERSDLQPQSCWMTIELMSWNDESLNWSQCADWTIGWKLSRTPICRLFLVSGYKALPLLIKFFVFSVCKDLFQSLFSVCSWFGEKNKKSVGFLPVLFGSSSLLDQKQKHSTAAFIIGWMFHHHQLLIIHWILAAALYFACLPNILVTGESLHWCWYHQCRPKKSRIF